MPSGPTNGMPHKEGMSKQYLLHRIKNCRIGPKFNAHDAHGIKSLL